MNHKCDGCQYKGEHQEMMFRPFGVCLKELNLIEAEKAFNAKECPHKIEKQIKKHILNEGKFMSYKYKETRANSDDTWNWDIIGEFPVKFIDFFKWVLNNENSFRVEFGASNKCYGGWLGNRLEAHKIENKWYWENREPENWFEEIANKNITKCWANGGWGQMLYICTFEE